jgi:Ca-activated chloride channel family protein
MTFAEPNALLMLVPLLPLVIMFAISYRRGLSDLGSFAPLRPRLPRRAGLAGASTGPRRQAKNADPRKVFLFKRFFEALLTCLAVAAIVFAIAGIRWGEGVVEEPRIGAEVVVVVDLSRSMAATDAEPTRLGRSLQTLRAILAAAPPGRMALVVFGDQPHQILPFTDDFVAVDQSLSALADSTLGGSNLAAALEFATELSGRTGSARTLLLASDGETSGGDALAAARVAAARGVAIVALQAGTVAGSTILTPDSAVRSSADPALLRQLAATTGGIYLAAVSSAEQSEAAVAFIAEASRRADGRSFRVEPSQRYPLMVVIGIAALVLGQLTRRVRWHELF